VDEGFTFVFGADESFEVEGVFCGGGWCGFVLGVVFLVGEGVACGTHHLIASLVTVRDGDGS
jgi:hypothetical protein